MNKEREKKLKELQELDFRMLDLQLFLDTHPFEERAVEEYNNAAKKYNAMKSHFEKLYGPLMLCDDNYTTQIGRAHV